MSKRSHIATLATALALACVPLTACNEGSFAGGSAKKSAAAKKPSNGDKPEKPGKPGKPDKPGGDTDQDADLGNTTPGGNGDGAKPGTDVDSSGGDVLVPDEPLLDNDSVVQPNDNDIVFGPDKLFHIGDGQLTATSCKIEVEQFGVTGTRYFFEFEVKKPNTTVEITLLKICGVDKADSNFVSVKQGNTVLATIQVPVNATSLAIPAQVLGVGKYYVEVESRLGSVENPTDADDFLVGKVEVKASAPIRPGQVGTI